VSDPRSFAASLTPRPLFLALLALQMGACAPAKLLRLENEVLKSQLAELHADIESCEQDAPPPDYATHVTLEVIRDYLTRSNYPPTAQPAPAILTLQVKGEHRTYQLNVQIFEREKVLFLAVTDYIAIEQASSSSAMVLMLTQLASMNYELLLGKFQLNPATGEISLSVELNLEDGLGFRTFQSVLGHLLRTADARYPDLVRASKGHGL
jgi:hypothetical protein